MPERRRHVPARLIVGDPSSNSDEWTAEYVRRAGEVMDTVLDSGAKLVWVGIPNDNNPEVTADLAVQNAAVKEAIAARSGVTFIDTWKRFAGRSGGWAELVVDPRDGKAKPVRQSDGFHLNTDGAEILAIDISTEVKDILNEMGADVAATRNRGHQLDRTVQLVPTGWGSGEGVDYGLQLGLGVEGRRRSAPVL